MIDHIVPFYSQFSKDNPKIWRYRGCGITALKMIFDYWQKIDKKFESPKVEEILKTGLQLNAYIEKVGWSHKGLVEISRKFGYDGCNYDLAQTDVKEAYQALINDLNKFPILASVWNFRPNSKDGHVVVLTGISENIAHMNDPKEKNELNGYKKISLDSFLKSWKKRYIAIFPQSLLPE
ncbi:MAG: C39 family peptidase [Parcubacteria group bacterium]|nr:C39 family peptidase [Parcubacteria group bacterium]